MTSHHHHGHEHGHGHGHGRDEATTSTAGACGGHAPSTDALAQANADDIAQCPVMTANTVIKSQAEATGLYRDHGGQRYWLCCEACGPLFDADPQRYAAA